MLVLTAYFVDKPEDICNSKRENPKYIGNSLSFQTGPTLSSLMTIPLNEKDIPQTKWIKGKCVYGMGKSVK